MKRFSFSPEGVVHLFAALQLVKLGIASTSERGHILSHVSGEAAMTFLLLSLVMTPLFLLTGKSFLPRLKKPLGLYAFFLSSLHLGLYAFEEHWDVWKLWDQSLEDPSFWAAWVALLGMVPLAVTSTRGWMRRLGRRWKRLHQVVYVLSIAAVIHVFLLEDGLEKGAFYSILLLTLLSLRLPFFRRFLAQRRPSVLRLQSRLNPRKLISAPSS